MFDDDEARIRRASKEAKEAKRIAKAQGEARRRGNKVTQGLERQVRFLALMNRALLEVLLEHELTDLETFASCMEELDEALDGQAGDGVETSDLADELGLEMPEFDKKEAFKRSLRFRRKRRPSFDD